MDNFAEYLWYLLTAPFKRVKKAVNSWYILCRVLGRRLDEAKENLLRARDEGMIATCSPEMLPIHAADRGLVRYDGETDENFRVRIANYEEVCRLGGSNEGVKLAVENLGYTDVEVIPAPEWTGETERWAEFYVVVTLPEDSPAPTDFETIKRDVRAIKEVGAKDCYAARWAFTGGDPVPMAVESTAGVWVLVEHPALLLPSCGFQIQAKTEQDTSGKLIMAKDLWYFDGIFRFDGQKTFSAGQSTEVII